MPGWQTFLWSVLLAVGNFQGIKLLRFQVRQDSLDCPVCRLFYVKTEDALVNFSCHVEKIPSRFKDFSFQAVTIEIFDQSPALPIGLAFEPQRVGQKRTCLDQDGHHFDLVCQRLVPVCKWPESHQRPQLYSNSLPGLQSVYAVLESGTLSSAAPARLVVVPWTPLIQAAASVRSSPAGG